VPTKENPKGLKGILGATLPVDKHVHRFILAYCLVMIVTKLVDCGTSCLFSLVACLHFGSDKGILVRIDVGENLD
jgi:hypothetical protein